MQFSLPDCSFSCVPTRITRPACAVLSINRNSEQGFYDKLKPEGGKWKSNGGESIPFLSAVRIFMLNPLKLDDKDKTMIGKQHRGMIFKNKTGKPTPAYFTFHLITTDGMYIDYAWDLVETGLQTGVLEQRGRFWYHGDSQIAGSREQMELLAQDDLDVSLKLELAVMARIADLKEIPNAGPQDDAENTDADTFSGDPADQQLQGETPGV